MPDQAAAAISGPNAWLLGRTAEVALLPGENVLGREGEGIILMKSSTVSRRHARIVIDAKGAVIEDLKSKNGTFVNDRRVSGPTPVAEGDQVRIGSFCSRSAGHRPRNRPKHSRAPESGYIPDF